MHQERNPPIVSLLLAQLQDLQYNANSLSDARKSDSGSSSGPFNPLLFRVPGPCLASILDCCTIHGISGPLQETFLNDHLLKKDDPPDSSTIQRIWPSSSQELRPDIAGTSKTRTAESVKTSTTLPKWRWIVKSYWWILFSRWFDGLSEISDFGIASGKIT